jgi:uncharacterized protein YukJ
MAANFDRAASEFPWTPNRTESQSECPHPQITLSQISKLPLTFGGILSQRSYLERPGGLSMSIGTYGVLKGKVIDKFRGQPNDKTPHYEIHVTASAKHYRVAVNVRSQQSPPDVLFFADENFQPPHEAELKSLSGDFTPLGKNDDIAVDYVRSKLFDHTRMKPLPATAPDTNNDLEDVVDKYVTLAMTKPGAMIYAFGAKFGPPPAKDPQFGFSPELGVHDIHMNQGNSGSFVKDDGVFQDGALFINLPEGDQWIALFLAFQSQSFQTDDRTGHKLTASAVGAGGHGPVSQPPSPPAGKSKTHKKKKHH